jgi:putative DNA primase/helicase
MPKFAKKSLSREDYLQVLERFREEVRERYPLDRAIEDLAGVRFVQRAGSVNRMACCPFHQEKSPSFSVNPQAGYYYCFGSGCGAKGDLFGFIMDHENVSFMEAMQIAGRNAGVPFPAPDGKTSKSGPKVTSAKRKPALQRDRRMHPGDMPLHDLIPVPDRVRAPKAGVWASAWHEGNTNRAPDVRRYKPSMVHEYRNSAGQLLMSVLRVEMRNKTRDNGKPMKFFMPFRLSELPEKAKDEVMVSPETRLGWLIRGVPPGHLRPVYGMERVPEWREAGGRRVLIVEGEKTADAARRLLSGAPDRSSWIVFSPLGGGNSALHADWSDLAVTCPEIGGEIEVLVWPDADAPTIMRKTGESVDRQKAYATDIVNGLGYALNRAGVDLDRVRFSRIRPVEDVESGWDLADAEQEGWSGDDLLKSLESDRLPVEPDPDFVRSERPAPEEADAPYPFDHDDSSVDVDAYDALISEIGEMQDENEMSQSPAENQTDPNAALDMDDALPSPDLPSADPAPSADTAVEDLKEEDVLDPNSALSGAGFEAPVVRLSENRFFRCLGFLNGHSYFLSLESNQVFELSPSKMKQTYLLHLAPAKFWLDSFPGPADRNGVVKTDWEAAVDVLIRATNRAGQYDPCSQVGQGTWMDNNRIIFNSGRDLWVEGEGVVNLHDFVGEKTYVVGKPCGMPDFDNPFPADAPEIWELLDIIRAIHWAPEGRKVSVMNMFGWLAIGPICGVLPWRPHLYLSGERGVGKSWIINNIINRIFSDYGENVKADSTESGLRNLLNGRAFPLIFDEAEGETLEDRQRMAKIIRLARHSATPGNSYVAQGVSGGGGQRQFAIASTFLMCSITPQLTASADFTRFGRAHLMGGLSHYDFLERIKGPAARLLDKTFSGRFMARMIMRAKDMDAVSTKMQEGLSSYNMEQRLIDVYGTYLAGAWLLLRDDVPESGMEAMSWVRQTFDMVDDLMSQVQEISEDKDHVRLFRTLLSGTIKVESMSIGTRHYSVGELIQILLGTYPYEDAVPLPEAVRALARLGIKLGRDHDTVKDTTTADCLFIHKNSTEIERLLEKTSYAKSYVDVMSQAKGVQKGKVVNFVDSNSRTIIVPLTSLPMRKDEQDGRTEPARDE